MYHISLITWNQIGDPASNNKMKFYYASFALERFISMVYQAKENHWGFRSLDDVIDTTIFQDSSLRTELNQK